jgi:branched-chain amino acid transport system permease protein
LLRIRIRHALAVVIACFAFVGALWSPAHADDVDIKVRVQNVPSVPGEKKQPVEGVTVVALDPSGAEVAKGVTNAKGIADLTVPPGVTYTIKLDASTLPDGLALPEGDAGERQVEATGGLGGNASFNLGAGGPEQKSKLELLPQTLLNGIRFGLVIAIMSVGLSLIYATTGLSNFAHAETVTLGAVSAMWFDNSFRIFDATSGFQAVLQLGLATLFGMACAAAFSGLLETRVWRPMRRRRIGLTSMMIVSIGVAIFLRFMIQLRFGAQPKAYAEFSSQRNLEFGPFGITPRDLAAAVISLVCLGGVAYMLMRTRTGKAIRAVSDNPDLSSATGINTDRIILFVWVLGGALAGLGGVLFGLDEQVQWNMGSRLLLLMFAAITLGGLGRPFGALVGSLVVGLFVQLWAWWFSDFTDLKYVGALGALIVILLVRPQGILGKKERIG